MSTAIVVGAGIGGVTAAVALQRCGWQVTVLERAPELGEVGAGISVWPSAVAVLEELGVKGVEKASVPSRPAGMRKPDGRWVVSAAELGVEIPVMIHRAQLHDLITAEFDRPVHTKPFGMDVGAVTVRTGYDVTAVEQDAEGVTVNGELRAELLVAADGIRSVVRGALYPQYVGPRYSGFTAYRGIADVELHDGVGETWGRGQLFGFARLIDGRFYWYGTANQPAGTTSEPTVFEGWHDPIPRLIAGSEKILQNDIYDLTLPLVPFAQGRVVLLGDAAHAMTPNLGRGACSAIEDAGALGRHLSSANLHKALTAYDAERRPATTKLVKRSRALGRFAQTENPLVCTLREAAFTLGGKLLALRKH
ncbi:2-polyprenyl-6-methoxyphenol hydroxylase-like FAD-dependent oxidoreductase [Kribbella aluminosa]|uniref:2-polyprenyl-6-methoxyphenol hydroxylase-like FAD-dependent oxidoreductase n=1 Tax=Kribbella aluminosa TaxID=416017 RepID=A0ABS4UP14_9ACTN|nr:FAD-dependent monooxygenase [Kribbella aluminosa]MBP2353385.1 2-polyprenyl-6-methoxyphenol hydroxylase-like FAD-dependent oxidoreductase [Kribbella aluminosa]